MLLFMAKKGKSRGIEMRNEDTYLKMVCAWIESGQLKIDKPRTEEEARIIAYDLLNLR